MRILTNTRLGHLDGAVRYTEAPARRAELLQRLAAEGYVASARLAAELGVSEMTIRRDLGQLHLEGLARRVTGGATLPYDALTFAERNRAGAAEKRAIARACVGLIGGAATVALDAGTTIAPLADLVVPGTSIITHSVPVINACTARNDLDLVVVGGTYQADTQAFAGPATRAGFDDLLVDVAVLTATGVDASGLLCVNPLDAETKRAIAGIAERVIVLVDHAKLGRRAPIRVGSLDLVDVLVTDSGATPEQLDALRSAGVHVVVAQLEDAEPSASAGPGEASR